MTHPAIVDPGEGVFEAAMKMVQPESRRLVVVDGERKPIGIVTPTDILTGMVNLESGFRVRPTERRE